MEESAKTKKEIKEEKKREANRKAAAENMQKKQAARFDENGKVITSYDKKVEKRKKEAKQDKRNEFILKICAVVILTVIAAGLVFSVGRKTHERFGTAVTVNGEKIGRVEYDFYYNMSVNNFLNTYGAYASYFGLDTEKDFAKQTYQGDETWDDYFNDGAVTMIKQTKALSAEADKNSFEYDVTGDYDDFNKSIEDAASEEGTRLSVYYKDAFGQYASKNKIEKYVKQYLRATAYYENYSKNITFTDSEKKEYYEANKDTYDVIDYRYLEVSDVEKANEMLNLVTDSDSFKSLCTKYAADDVKSEYTSSDKSLVTGTSKSGVAGGTDVASWLFASGRAEGDKTVITTSSDPAKTYVVYFIKRYTTDAQNTIMEDNMKNEKSEEYLEEIIKNMEAVSGTVKLYEAAE
ncbi:MAG: hypothetical protein PUE71_04920 [Clostridia bacterium]|nr:hypothetical protein [Clostridia bacterium]